MEIRSEITSSNFIAAENIGEDNRWGSFFERSYITEFLFKKKKSVEVKGTDLEPFHQRAKQQWKVDILYFIIIYTKSPQDEKDEIDTLLYFSLYVHI